MMVMKFRLFVYLRFLEALRAFLFCTLAALLAWSVSLL